MYSVANNRLFDKFVVRLSFFVSNMLKGYCIPVNIDFYSSSKIVSIYSEQLQKTIFHPLWSMAYNFLKHQNLKQEYYVLVLKLVNLTRKLSKGSMGHPLSLQDRVGSRLFYYQSICCYVCQFHIFVNWEAYLAYSGIKFYIPKSFYYEDLGLVTVF